LSSMQQSLDNEWDMAKLGILHCTRPRAAAKPGRRLKDGSVRPICRQWLWLVQLHPVQGLPVQGQSSAARKILR